MTAYQLTPVGPEGPEPLRMTVIVVRSYEELLAENRRLKADVEVWHQAWATAVNNRIADRKRLSRSMRVLASLGRLSPRMADLVAAAGRDIWQLDRAARMRQSKATRKAREIWRLDP